MARSKRTKPVAEVVEAQVKQHQPATQVSEPPPEPDRLAPQTPEAPASDTYTPPTTASGGPGTVRAHGDHAERPPFESTEHPKSHAAAVGRREPRYNEQGITDKLAGARLLEHHDPFYSIIRFEEKPSDAVREKLREASFQWNTPNKEWSRPIRFETRQQDRINAEEVFEDVCRVIRAERGIVHSFGGA